MIHYNLWFRFRGDVDETESLSLVHAFLNELRRAGSLTRFQLLKNSGVEPRSKLLPFQALMEFRDDAQFSAAFSAQAESGIRTGMHGRVMTLVSDFQIEVFRQITGFDS
jgi:hypothetical protein